MRRPGRGWGVCVCGVSGFVAEVFAEEVDHVARGEDFGGDVGLCGHVEGVGGDGAAFEASQFCVDDGVGFGFVCAHEDDAVFLEEFADFGGVGDLFVDLAGAAPDGGEVDVDGVSVVEGFGHEFGAPGVPDGVFALGRDVAGVSFGGFDGFVAVVVEDGHGVFDADDGEEERDDEADQARALAEVQGAPAAVDPPR